MSKYNFAKLIHEGELISLIPNDINANDLNLQFLDPIFKRFQKSVSKLIIVNDLKEPNYYRFELTIHAQEKNNES